MVGKLLGKYKITAKIGQGGMGTVYRGFDTELKRPVAIKILAEHLSSEKRFIRRFQKEAESVAKLNHPNIVHIYDIGKSGGLHYLVMEYVDGETLKCIIKDGRPLPFREVIRIVEQIAFALDYAHGEGIVHRDVKPGNVLIFSGNRKVKVTDFGLALALEGLRLTVSGQIVGTPEYISPEQALGKNVRFPSDLYSLGVMTYEMLAGKHPFTSENAIGMIYKHAYESPSPIAGLPLALQSVLMKVMAKDPSSRYVSARAFVEDLRRANAGKGRLLLSKGGIFVLLLIAVFMSVFFISRRKVELRALRLVEFDDEREGKFSHSEKTVEVQEEVKEPAPLYFQEAEILLREGKYTDAEKKFKSVVNENPGTGWAEIAEKELKRIQLKIKEERAEELEREFNSAIKDVDTLLDKGRYGETRLRCNFMLEQYGSKFRDTIVKRLERIRKEESEHYARGVFYANQGKAGKALEHFHVISDEMLGAKDRIMETGLVLIPAGEFVKRDSERNKLIVYLEAYYIDRHEITNTRYKKFLPSHEFPPGCENYPVTEVSWHDACAYAGWAGMDLPTEDEWEKAAFGVDGRKYPWGRKFSSLRCNAGGSSGASAVGTYHSGVSPYGLYDMIGNVWEWTLNPVGIDSPWRIIMGASWNEVPVKGQLLLRASLNANTKRTNVGFRCCWRSKTGNP